MNNIISDSGHSEEEDLGSKGKPLADSFIWEDSEGRVGSRHNGTGEKDWTILIESSEWIGSSSNKLL